MAIAISAISLLKGIKNEFSDFLAKHEGAKFRDFVFQSKSNSDRENYRFKASLPFLKEWVDEIEYGSFNEFKYEIVNKHFQRGIDIDRDDYEDAKSIVGNIEQEIRMLAQQFADFPDYLVNSLISANGNCFDGGAFFATSHTAIGTIDNLKTGTGTTLAQIEADLATARNAMYGYVDLNSVPINRNPRFVVLAPSQLHDKFLTLRNSQQIYDGSGNKTNIYENSFDLIINHWQSTSDNDWYLVNVNHAIKPFIYQLRQQPKWHVEDIESSKRIHYFVEGRMNAGYGNPAAMCKVNN